MKKIILLCSICLSIITMYAQNPITQYGLAVETKTYRPIDMDYNNFTKIDELKDWSLHNIPIGFDFEIAGKTFNQISAFTDGEITFEDFNNYPEGAWTISCFAATLIDKDVNTNENSTMRYVVDGNSGNQIFKLEYVNMGFSDGAVTDKTNFQIWLYEEGNRVEMHYGPTEIVDLATAFNGVGGIVAGLLEITWSDETYSGILLKNNPSTPDTAIIVNAQDVFSSVLVGAPVNGTIYRFCPDGIPCTETITSNQNINIQKADVRVFPNPAIEAFTLSFNLWEKANVQIEIFNIIGAKVYDKAMRNLSRGQQDIKIATTHLQKGIYWCRLTIDQEVITKKVKIVEGG